MKVSSVEVPPRQVALDIEVEQERVDLALDQAFKRVAGRVNVPGFRRGKAPRTMVERVVGRERIVDEAMERLVPDVVSEAIQQEGVTPFVRPRVDTIEFNPLRVRAIVSLEPTVELGDYRGLARIDRPTVAITPDQVDAVVDRLRNSHAQWVPVERPVQMGDRVTIDVRGEAAEPHKLVVDSKDAEYVVDPDGPAPAEGFAGQLVGAVPGEQKSFTLPLPQDYGDKAMAGKDVAFTVTVHSVKEKELPPLVESFAQQVGDFADVAAVRDAIEAELRGHEEQRVQRELESTAMDKLVEVSRVEFPPQVLEHQTDNLMHTFTESVERQGLHLDQYLRVTGKDESALRAEVQSEAGVRVARSLVLNAFARAENITVNGEEIQDEVRSIAGPAPDAVAAAMAALANEQTFDRIQGAIRERKAVARLVDLLTGAAGDNGPPEDASPKFAVAPEVTSDTEAQITQETAAAPTGVSAEAQEQP